MGCMMHRIMLLAVLMLFSSSTALCSEYHFHASSTPTAHLYYPVDNNRRIQQTMQNGRLAGLMMSCLAASFMNQHENQIPNFNYQLYELPTHVAPLPKPPPPTPQELRDAFINKKATKETQLLLSHTPECDDDSPRELEGDDESNRKNYLLNRMQRRIQAAQEASKKPHFVGRRYQLNDVTLQLIAEKKYRKKILVIVLAINYNRYYIKKRFRL